MVENWLGPSVIDKVFQDINDQDEEQNVTCIIADIWIYLDAIIFRWRLSKRRLFLPLPTVTFGSKAVALGLLPSDGIPFDVVAVAVCSSAMVNTCFGTGFA